MVTQDILKQGIRFSFGVILSLCIITGCNQEKVDFKTKSISMIGEEGYKEILRNSQDTIYAWKINSVYETTDTTYHVTFLDSLLCFNTEKDRLVGCILMQHTGVNRKSGSDGMTFMYGEKIKGKWYFYTGPFIVIPRSMVKGQNKKIPLTYNQLHQIALKEVYGGYLKDNGEINEEWFTSQFENVAFCTDCKTREDYQKNILEMSGAVWSNRDTTKPIIHLNKKETLP